MLPKIYEYYITYFKYVLNIICIKTYIDLKLIFQFLYTYLSKMKSNIEILKVDIFN